MIQPDETVVRAFAHIAQNAPAVKEFIATQYKTELDRLPHATSNMAVAQGRCQVWGEIHNLLQEAPVLAAESRRG